VGQELKDLLHHVTARAFVALAATEATAHSTNSPVYLLSWQTAIPSAKLQLPLFGLLLIILFERIRIQYSAYYPVQIEF